MFAVYISEGSYKYHDVLYERGVPIEVPKEDELWIQGCGKFFTAPNIDYFKAFPVKFSNNSKGLPVNDLPEDCSNLKILIKRFSALGDIIGTLSSCELLKSVFPTCNISLACKKEQHELVSLFPCVDKIVDYTESKKVDTYSQYDVLLDFFGVIENNEKRKTTDYYNLYRDKLGKNFENKDVILPKIDMSKLIPCDDWLNGRGISAKKYIILHVGGSSEMRKWEDDKWKRLAYEIGEYTQYKVIVTGNSHDFVFEDPKHNIYAACNLPFKLLFSLILDCKLLVTTDTGMVHFGGLLEVPMVSLWCNTNPDSVISYYNQNKQYKIISDCQHKFCFALQRSFCPFLSVVSACMKKITLDMVKNVLSNAGINFDYQSKTSKNIEHLISQNKKCILYSTVYGEMEITHEDVVLSDFKTNILYITQSEKTAYSGGRYYGWLNAKLLAELGFTVWVLTQNLPPFYKDFIEGYEGEFNVIVDSELNPLNFKCKFDYVIGEPYYTGEYAVKYGKQFNVPIVNYVYETPNYIRECREGDDSKDEFWKTHKEAMLNSDIIVPLCDFGKVKLEEWDQRFKNKKIIPVTPTINEKVFNKIVKELRPKLTNFNWYKCRKKYKYIFVSMHKFYKKLDFFIEAVAKTSPGCCIAVVGHGVSKILQKYTDLNIKIDVFENCSDAEKIKAIFKSRIMVCPSVFEGFGITALEAMRLRKKLIVSDLPIFRENYKNYPVYFKPDDMDSLIEAMIKSDGMYKDIPFGTQNVNNKEVYNFYSDNYGNKRTKEKLKKVFELKKHIKKDLVLGAMTPYNEKCGIAENTKYFLDKIKGVTIFAPSKDNVIFKDSPNILRVWNRNFTSYNDLLDKIKEKEINLLHIQHEFSFFQKEVGITNFIEFLKKVRMSGVKTIVTYHTYCPDKGIHSLINSIVDWTTVCNWTIFNMIKMNNFNLNMSFIPLPCLPCKHIHFIDARAEAKFSNLNFSSTEKIIGMHGFWQPHKGYHVMIKALPKILQEHPNTRLLIIGYYDPRSDYAMEVKGMIRELGLTNRVLIVSNYLPIGQVMLLLRCCNILVYDYSVEKYYSSSAAIRTGLSASVPIIASNSSLFSDLKDVITRIVKMNDVNSLANMVNQTMSTSENNMILIRKNQDDYAKRFSVEYVTNAYRNLYSNILSKGYDFFPKLSTCRSINVKRKMKRKNKYEI